MAISHEQEQDSDSEKAPRSFQRKKAHILAALSLPRNQYTDLSPKGTVDEGIRHLIHKINQITGCVTTSSCAGRVSIFLEGRKEVTKKKKRCILQDDLTDQRLLAEVSANAVENLLKDTWLPTNQEPNHKDKPDSHDGDELHPTHMNSSSVGGKGNGGRWLFVSHDPIPLPIGAYQMKNCQHQDNSLRSPHLHKENIDHNVAAISAAPQDEDGTAETPKSCIEMMGMLDLETCQTYDVAQLEEVAKHQQSTNLGAPIAMMVDRNKNDIIRETGGVIAATNTHPMNFFDLSLQFCRPDFMKTARLIHLKFEPMILHIMTASLDQANRILTAAIQAGFRESGAVNLVERARGKDSKSRQNQKSTQKVSSATVETRINNVPTPVVAIRSSGLTLESVVGLEWQGRHVCIVPEWQLRGLLLQVNQRFDENKRRIERFTNLLLKKAQRERVSTQDHQLANVALGSVAEWEDAGVRKCRKRQEGLDRAKIKREDLLNKSPPPEQDSDNHIFSLDGLTWMNNASSG